ncbi:MAG: outer membrane beta-barrel protein [Alphaproteobacteria bacterium]|nr:outer membrane beta-barrel protein [Alphaproteobacteria bacterium]
MSSSQAQADYASPDFSSGCAAGETGGAKGGAMLLHGVGRFLTGFAIALIAFPAFAQTEAPTAKEDSVGSRARPDYDPLGIESRDLLTSMGLAADPFTGSFLIFPKADVGFVYDDNIYRIETDERSDKILRFSPGVRIQSDWDNHLLTLRAGANIGRYQDNGSEDYEDFNFGGSGVVDLTERTSVGGGISFAKSHTDRASPDDSGQGIPLTDTFQTTYRLNAAFKGERFSFRTDGEWTVLDFDDAGPINNDDQDRDEYRFSFRVGYEFLRGTTLFVQPSYKLVEYDQSLDDGGRQRSSDGYRLLSGLEWDISGVTFLKIGAGFLEQKFDDVLFGTVSGPAFTVDFVWNATDLMTFTLELDRTVEETTLVNASGILNTKWSFAVDYDPLENLIFTLGGSMKNEDYEGVTREEDTLRFHFIVKYLIHPEWVTEFRYQYEDRDSNEIGESYKDNRWLAQFTFRL